MVVEEHRDASQGDKLYRSVTHPFLNDSYYIKGLHLTGPMNYKGQRYSLSYAYDDNQGVRVINFDL